MRPLSGLEVPLALCEARDLDGQRAEACAWAKEWLSWRALCCERPAAVFDIDATLLHVDEWAPAKQRESRTQRCSEGAHRAAGSRRAQRAPGER